VLRLFGALVAAAALQPGTAAALDKQGSAHGGSVAGPDWGINLDGNASLGVSIFNPSYAARPNNTGLALFRYAAHADLDLIGRRLSIPLDLNMFTDRTASGAAKLRPSELDFIGGLTTTWDVGPGALEGGVRVEHDGAADTVSKPYSQTYVDVRARYLYSVAAAVPSVGDRLRGGDLAGWLTLGWFAYNPTYAARPDNSGLALLRYGAHWELSTLDSHLAFGADVTMFTDRCSGTPAPTAAALKKNKPSSCALGNPVAPTELDFTAEIIGRYKPVELHLAVEQDAPFSRGFYFGPNATRTGPHDWIKQTFVYALVQVSFHGFSYMPPRK
jgi:hypothetical protein